MPAHSSIFRLQSCKKLQSGISGELRTVSGWVTILSQGNTEALRFVGVDRIPVDRRRPKKAQVAVLCYSYAGYDRARRYGPDAFCTCQPASYFTGATTAARALGNIFIPALNAVLPYAIAFLKVIRMVADALASLFGFSLPEIDYSGVNGLASSGEDAADALGDAAGNRQEAKRFAWLVR